MEAGAGGAKELLPYLQRADEVDGLDAKVAYYCRMRALEVGVTLPARDAETEGLLTSLLAKLEQDKSAGRFVLGDDDGRHVEGFALKLFARADGLDRAGGGGDWMKVAKTFYAAACFLDVLRTFGEPAPEIAAKQKYAAWRSAAVRQAAREGREPEPPPQDHSAAAALPPQAQQLQQQRAPAALAPAAGAPPGLKPPAVPLASSPTLSEAQQCARYAHSALSFEDAPTAVTYLKRALALLGSPEP